jgi:hypothetical protein
MRATEFEPLVAGIGSVIGGLSAVTVSGRYVGRNVIGRLANARNVLL